MLSVCGRMRRNDPMRFKHLAFIPLVLVGILVVNSEGGEKKRPEEWDVRFTGNDSRCFGWLEIFHQDKWKRIYSNSWKSQNAKVACKQLYCGPILGMLNQTFTTQEKQERCMTISCQGNETALKDCKPHTSNCSQYLNVAIFCHEHHKTSEILQTSAPLVTSSKTPDLPRRRLEGGTSLCSGTEGLHLGDHWEMICLGLQKWRTQLTPRVCQEEDCNDGLEIKDQGRMQQPEQWAKVQCEKMNLSFECLNRTKECLSISLMKCSGQDAKGVSYTETILKILLGLVLTAVFFVICVPLTYKKLMKTYSKKQQHQWIGPNGVNQNALEGATHRSSNPLDYSSDSGYDLCSAQQL